MPSLDLYLIVLDLLLLLPLHPLFRHKVLPFIVPLLVDFRNVLDLPDGKNRRLVLVRRLAVIQRRVLPHLFRYVLHNVDHRLLTDHL